MPYEAKLYKVNDLSEGTLIKTVLPHYAMENAKIEQIKFKDTDKQRAVYRVEYNNEVFCLKKVYFGVQDLLFVYSAIEWLYRNKINVPRLLPTREKGRFVQYNNMLFILTPWIDGIKCSYDNIDHIMASISNLADIHNCSEDFTPVFGSSNRGGFENLANSLQKHFNQLLNCSNLAFKYKDRFSKTYLNNFEENIELAELSARVSASIQRKNLKTSLCHLDYVNKNIIFDNDSRIWIIDFDKCKMDYCVHDIAYFLRRLLKRDNTKWNIQTAINALKVYEEKRPLTLDEYRYILAYLSFPQKYWKISRDYYNNISKCNKSSFQTLISKAVEKTEFHAQFIGEFKQYIEDKFKAKL
ncbi:CotS family spore coat protein [Clostridium thermarum]|uniref:CotS family spore coat protein n=1 Tax=Clostridium thermarum TaxID=1716543 RepID=UPI0013D1DDE8|nr:CotS family spore coat protein [Clostridium thermarum]